MCPKISSCALPAALPIFLVRWPSSCSSSPSLQYVVFRSTTSYSFPPPLSQPSLWAHSARSKRFAPRLVLKFPPTLQQFLTSDQDWKNQDACRCSWPAEWGCSALPLPSATSQLCRAEVALAVSPWLRGGASTCLALMCGGGEPWPLAGNGSAVPLRSLRAVDTSDAQSPACPRWPGTPVTRLWGGGSAVSAPV